VYQIYPRSFMDSNGDGIGDLEGIRAKLDHLEFLGVDAIWLSPIYPSPMADFGYDVANYCDISPEYGDLAQFDRLLAEAHARNIKVILDWVPNHSSDRHPWFLESRSSRSNPKRDWYLWRDAGDGGAPPNNWISIFGGSAWEFDPKTEQFYLHSFLKEQPDLNWRNPELKAAMFDSLRFWLDRGVDGFRIDVIHRIGKDPELRSNPLIAGGGRGYGGQQHLYDENYPDVHELLRELRRLVDSYPERMTVGEIGIYDPAQVATYLGRGDELHLAFNFCVLLSTWDAASFARELDRFDSAVPPEAWPDVVLSNHDVPRHASRYDDPVFGESRARVAAVLLLCARGTPFMYYGEELGMRNGEIPRDRLRDPIAWTLHEKFSRDPERTPMHWSAAPGAGFTAGDSWLPLAADFATRNVELQRADRGSLLWLYREIIALRRRTPALERGSYKRLDAPDGVLAFERRDGASLACVALNFTSDSHALGFASARVRDGLITRAGAQLPRDAARLELGPNEAAVLVVDA
jgi:glycosidase